MKHIISFSGGKDSTAMLLGMIERGMPIDYVLCVDTTKEFPTMYKHIKQIDTYIKPLNVTILPIDYDYWFSEHIKTRGPNKGKRGYGWPDWRNRWCTALKRDLIKRFISSLQDEVIEYLGIAVDEPKRIKTYPNRNIVYPMVDWKMTEEGALAYCYSRGFTWDGLYKKFHRVSCWCCPLKRIEELKTLYSEFPELWKSLTEMDKKSYRRFRSDYSINDLENKFGG